MFGVYPFNRVIVAARARKIRSGAILAPMNVKPKESCFTFLRKSKNLRHDQHATILLIKPNASGQLWVPLSLLGFGPLHLGIFCNYS